MKDKLFFILYLLGWVCMGFYIASVWIGGSIYNINSIQDLRHWMLWNNLQLAGIFGYMFINLILHIWNNFRFTSLRKELKKLHEELMTYQVDAGYQAGQEHKEQAIIAFIERWNGETNSHMGQLLRKKFIEFYSLSDN